MAMDQFQTLDQIKKREIYKKWSTTIQHKGYISTARMMYTKPLHPTPSGQQNAKAFPGSKFREQSQISHATPSINVPYTHD
jgi:hypothetical protein